MKKNPELIKLLIINAILLLSVGVFYLIGFLHFGSITDFDPIYLWIFIFISGFAVFALLSLIVFLFNTYKRK
ncbi:MAG: hypothetical protein RBR85_02190 [Bacilli bacterium]|jgi:hypothetical protein|nr:hypothetical protein [Bacilli bacterium]